MPRRPIACSRAAGRWRLLHQRELLPRFFGPDRATPPPQCVRAASEPPVGLPAQHVPDIGFGMDNCQINAPMLDVKPCRSYIRSITKTGRKCRCASLSVVWHCRIVQIHSANTNSVARMSSPPFFSASIGASLSVAMSRAWAPAIHARVSQDKPQSVLTLQALIPDFKR
jgi:hypothetical protein